MSGQGDGVWAAVVGQPDAVAALRHAVHSGRPSHAWLVTGPAGSGRSVAAAAFGAALVCPRSGCGACAECRNALAGRHPDVTLLRPEGLSIGVDAVRALVVDAVAAPVAGPWRVVVIEDADRLTEDAANALLKALEEPGPRTVFVLCAPSVEDVLPTIRSRCRLLRLRLPRVPDVAAMLQAEGVDAALAAFAARAALGHVGRARRLATDEAARRRRAEVLRLPAEAQSVPAALIAAANLTDAAKADAEQTSASLDAAETSALKQALGVQPGRGAPRGSGGALKALERAQQSRATRGVRDSLDLALTDLAAWYRDVLVAQFGAAVPAVHPDQRDTVARAARASTPVDTLRRLEAVLACRAAIDANANPQIAVEALAVALVAPPSS